MHEQEVQQEQGLENMRMFEAQLRLQLHPEEQKEASIVNGGSLKKLSKARDRQDTLKKSSHISRRKYQKRHQLVISWRSDKRLAKQEVETVYLRAGGNSSTISCYHLCCFEDENRNYRTCWFTCARCQGQPRRTSCQKEAVKRSLEKVQKRETDERFRTNSGALSDTRSVSDERLPKRKRCDKIEFVAVKFNPDHVILD